MAGTDRARSGPFASLLDQVLRDDEALEALAFAYSELDDAEGRSALAQAVLQDAADPIPALSIMLAVEPTPSLRHRLAAWIGLRGRVERVAQLEGTDAEGSARLIQRLPGLEPEALTVVWKDHDIEQIEIESANGMSFVDPIEVSSAEVAAERLTPLLWRHIRSGRGLPEGIDRFAPFFAPTPATDP